MKIYTSELLINENISIKNNINVIAEWCLSAETKEKLINTNYIVGSYRSINEPQYADEAKDIYKIYQTVVKKIIPYFNRTHGLNYDYKLL